MSVIARRAVNVRTFRAARTPLRQTRRTYAADKDSAAEQTNVLSKGAKKDPELYTLFAIMSGAFALVGWHFSRNPTSSSSESKVSMAPGSEPWNTGGDAKYQYHPGGDRTKAKKDAPSALNEVVIPNVNLPRALHEKYNKWGKEGY